MTNKMTVMAPAVRGNGHLYNGTGSHAHSTFARETVAKMRQDDGLILLPTLPVQLSANH